MEMSKLFSKEIRSELLCDLSRQQRVYSTLSTKTVCNQNEKPIFGRPGFDVERMVEVQIQMFLNSAKENEYIAHCGNSIILLSLIIYENLFRSFLK